MKLFILVHSLSPVLSPHIGRIMLTCQLNLYLLTNFIIKNRIHPKESVARPILLFLVICKCKWKNYIARFFISFLVQKAILLIGCEYVL